MNRSGLEDPEQPHIMHVPRAHHLHDSQKPEMNRGPIHHCMLKEEAELTLPHSQAHVAGSYDRLEGEVLISNRQRAFQEAAVSNRHSCFAKAPSAWRAPKRLESTAPKTFLDPIQRTNLVGAKLAGELSDADNMGLNTTSDLKLPGNLSRTCRICNKQFPSGRALGGHMRVHGPLFAPASSRSYGVGPGANLSHRENACKYAALIRGEEDDASTPSISHALNAAELDQDLLPHQDARSADHARRSGHIGGNDGTMLLDCDNGYAGELDAHHADSDEEKDLSSVVEKRNSSLANYNSQISHLDGKYTQEARMEANSTVRPSKSLLYKLRHNPKRSRWFADQQFASMARLSGKNSPPADGGNVCSECGKAFWSERALFGHMRCHPDRDRRIVLSPGDSRNSEQPVATMAARQSWKSSQSVVDKLMQSSEIQIGSMKGEFHKMPGAAEIEAAMMKIRNEALPGNAAIEENIGSEELVDKIEGQSLVACKEQHRRGSFDQEPAPARWRSAGRRSRRKVGSNKAGTIIMENRATSPSSPENEPSLNSETISFELGVEEQEIQTPDFLILLADAAQKIEEETVLPLSIEDSSHLWTDSVNRSKDQQVVGGDHYEHSENVYVGDALVHDSLVTGMSNGKYECTTCKKSFNSHQALGGHRASHKKTKGCSAWTGLSEASEEHSIEGEFELYYAQEKCRVVTHKKSRQQTAKQEALAFKGHACSICHRVFLTGQALGGHSTICHRVFLTGQALGGHKRCHWTGEKPSEAASIASTNKQFSLQSEGQSVVEGGIDLNMPAPMDEDADEVGFVPAEMHSMKSEIIDQEVEVEKVNVDVGSDLSLCTPAMAPAVKDLLDDTHSSSPAKETEVRGRFDGIWGQHWPNNIGVTQLHQPMYAMQSLV